MLSLFVVFWSLVQAIRIWASFCLYFWRFFTPPTNTPHFCACALWYKKQKMSKTVGHGDSFLYLFFSFFSIDIRSGLPLIFFSSFFVCSIIFLVSFLLLFSQFWCDPFHLCQCLYRCVMDRGLVWEIKEPSSNWCRLSSIHHFTPSKAIMSRRGRWLLGGVRRS